MLDKYSVLMSLYEGEKPKYLIEALDSTINQTVMPEKIVIVIDGLITDELEKVLFQYKDYISLVRLKENVGLGLALNEGMKHCPTELVARMDTDDIMKKDRCEKQLAFFRDNPQVQVLGTQIEEFINEPGDLNQSRKVPTSYEDIVKFSQRRNPFNHPSVMYKKSVVLENDGYTDMRRNQDYELFVRLIQNKVYVRNLNESLLYFRANPDNLKRRKSWNKVSSDIKLSYKFKKMGHSSMIDFLIVSSSHLMFYILPESIVSKLSNKFLRGRVE